MSSWGRKHHVLSAQIPTVPTIIATETDIEPIIAVPMKKDIPLLLLFLLICFILLWLLPDF